MFGLNMKMSNLDLALAESIWQSIDLRFSPKDLTFGQQVCIINNN